MTLPLSRKLFGENRLFTLPAGADFLGELSKTLVELTGAKQTPETLSDVLLFVPNRRSARALAGRIFADLGGQAFLPPDIRPLGDAGDNDPALLGELASVDVRPPMPAGARHGALARLVRAWHESQGDTITARSAVAIARDLMRLLDQAALAGQVDWDKLATVLEGSDLARHWQVSVDFLSILSKAWPDVLEENGFSDTTEQDRLAAEAMCARWTRSPPETPVFVVGSTGTSPATRMLMQAVTELPCGAVLFPGLDTETDDLTWQNILNAPSHPQHAFAETLKALDAPLSSVQTWPDYIEPAAGIPRRKLIQESLAPADMTADWVARLEARAAPMSRREMTEAGLNGLSLIETETEAEEADVIALMLRECLETEGKTAALVTPDAGLARRVSSLMAQWGVEVSPSAGTPLQRTRAGSFIFRVLDFLLDPGEPVAVMALLKHELTTLIFEEEKDIANSLLERGVFRGLRRWESFAELVDWAENLPERAEADDFRLKIDKNDFATATAPLTELEDRCAPLLASYETLIKEPFSVRKIAELIAEIADVLSKPKDEDGPSMLWSGEDGASAARFLEEAALFGDWSDDIGKDDIQPILEGLAQGKVVPPSRPGHAGISIWGPLEARLQSCDLIILGSLNEGVWPEPPGIDGFLPRHIRREIGLPDTEARIGLSAHDFAQLACSPRVVLTRSERVENKPSVASRWLWRLRILASGALESLDETDRRLTAETAHYRHWARQRQLGGTAPDIAPPAPRPPAEARPRSINVTDVTGLIRDPYAYYCKHVLGLQPLDQLPTPLGAREIGIAIHRALEHKDTKSDEGASIDDLLSAFERELRSVGGDTLFFAEREGIWKNAAFNYIEWQNARNGKVTNRDFEVRYVSDFEIGSGTVTLRGRADLVETLSDGTLAITDFKTGNPPSGKQVLTGLEPQLPLLAIIAEKGKAKSGPNAPTSELFYFGLGSKAGATSISDKGGEVAPLIDDAEAGFRKLMESYLQPSQPYLSGPRVQFAAKYTDYDRLARRSEWADAGAEPGGDA